MGRERLHAPKLSAGCSPRSTWVGTFDLTMATTDEAVLEFIGREGKSTEAVAQRFPGFDVMRLVRAQLVDIDLHEHETVGHVHRASAFGEMRFVLTPRGADAIGLKRQS
jgi:hypothetical protein